MIGNNVHEIDYIFEVDAILSRRIISKICGEVTLRVEPKEHLVEHGFIFSNHYLIRTASKEC